jgi:hypothetical protein
MVHDKQELVNENKITFKQQVKNFLLIFFKLLDLKIFTKNKESST